MKIGGSSLFRKVSIIFFLLCGVFLGNVYISRQHEAQAASYKYQVNTNVLNVRSSPSLKGKVIGVVKQNDVLNVIQVVPGNKWYEISYGSKIGYVYALYVKKVSSNTTVSGVALKISKDISSRIITLTAISTGTISPQYQFLVQDGIGWNVIQGYSANSTATYLPPQKGNKIFKVNVLSNGKVATATATYQDSWIIIIDPGHGGKDSGAIGINGAMEKNITLAIAKKVSKYFVGTNNTVYLTRTDDTYYTLSQRVAFAQAHQGDVYVSIHLNSYNGIASGIGTYYFDSVLLQNSSIQQSLFNSFSYNPYPVQSKDLATCIQNRLVQTLHLVNRGVQFGNFHVIRENTMPAVLTEIGFIDNLGDYNIISKDVNQELVANAIRDGIIDYIQGK